MSNIAPLRGNLGIIAANEDPAPIVAILTHLGLPARRRVPRRGRPRCPGLPQMSAPPSNPDV
jgi:hypothetical protein